MMSTLVNTAASTAQAPAAAGGDAAVQAAQSVATGAGQQPAATATAPAPAPAAAPFAQWLDQADGAAALPSLPVLPGNAFAALSQALQAAAPADVQSGTAITGADAGVPAADILPAAEGDDGAGAGAQDNTLLAAMAMPLMPLTPMQIAQAVQVAQGGDMAAGSAAGGERKPAGQAVGAGSGAVPGLGAAGQDGGRRADIALAQLPAQTTQAALQDDGAVRFAIQAAAGQAGSHAGANAGADSDARQDGAAERTVTAGTATATPQVAVAAPAGAQPGADTVKLAGPPTAWRQSLQEALGDRLQVQVGKNVEQAVIRLEPPQLGRIDIAIRHSNGTLEVNISASNGEVLRQLQTVSDNLRNDLAQRQYTDVAVSVTPTPKNSGASPFGDPQQQQQQGRGRQPGREQDEPGRALAEANHAGSAFSLGARDA
ncbi:flagellar hook-length control protein FliK [Massilia phyllosphaerae]|uniref:flagellar hook-length control protein FliK n=1 Tax=Massilia phyllosphaerae TaxID=3106034 RepID=UPI002B1CD8AE|nr:flagellar hook-length control protein FliK [Massilia sp. SGZ-792]